ncbi:MAG: sigma-70 family RNA polymerase sigma factor [Chitinophagaceae bacterium]|nr:sigma-70 family RNA polymerase sigma factor [Chitinophagaceae bacterium]
MQITIEQLVIDAKGGDNDAWKILYGKFQPAVYSIALQFCSDPFSAKDIVQETFVIAFLKLDELKEPAAFGGWIKTIAKRLAFRFKNKQSRVSISTNEIEISDDTLEQRLRELSDATRLSAALGLLPHVLQLTLMLRYFSLHSSYEQIASILSIPVGTVRSRLSEARRKLEENWNLTQFYGDRNWREQEKWNSFYHSLFTSLHQQESAQQTFINHLSKEVHIKLSSGAVSVGAYRFNTMVNDDRRCGSFVVPVNVYTAGNLTILEAAHINSAEHPNHCPTDSVLTLYRRAGRVEKMEVFVVPN